MTNDPQNEVRDLVEDALQLRRAWSYKSFASNTAATDLHAHGMLAFEAIQDRLVSSDLAELLSSPGLSGVLGALVAIGNRHDPCRLSHLLVTLPAPLIAQALAQGPLALRNESLAPELRTRIDSLQSHEDEEVRDWALRFEES
jgi:hypothetical protein